MMRQWFSQNADPTYAIMAFFVFFAVFMTTCVWLLKKNKTDFSKHAELPFNEK